MDIEQILSAISNFGVTICVLAYFIFRDYKFMSTLQNTLQVLVDTVCTVKDMIDRKEVM